MERVGISAGSPTRRGALASSVAGGAWAAQLPVGDKSPCHIGLFPEALIGRSGMGC